jgi:hypothetical protein
MGRPVTVGGTEFVGARLPVALNERIDEWAKIEGVGRSEAMRRLIELGLKAKRAPRPK